MLEGGEDPLFIARRLIRCASEDVGLADPQALTVALNAYQTYQMLGSPEGELTLAQAAIYLALAPKSNAAYVAYNAARAFVQSNPSNDVPIHLRNAPTSLMKDLGYGKEYKYTPDDENPGEATQDYLPERLKGKKYLRPR